MAGSGGRLGSVQTTDPRALSNPSTPHPEPPMRSVAAALAVAILSSAGSAQELVGKTETVFTASERVAAGGSVRIFSRMGDIAITEGSGDVVEYRAEKDVRRGRVEDIAFRVVRGSGGVTICAVYSDDDDCDSDGIHSDRDWNWGRNWRSRATVTITVKVPKGVLLRTSSGNGDVSVSVAASEARVSSGNGRIRVSGVTGRVDASSGNGDVTVQNSGGPVSAHSGNGDIRASMDRAGKEDLEFSSGNGHIEITMPADFSADVDASTGNGHVSVDFPITLSGRFSQSRVRGTIGNGGRRLRISSGNGSIEIRKGA
jgi:hypothetical protein